MLIAIDYDGTITAAPQLWSSFAVSATLAGHTVIVCTARAFPPSRDLPAGIPVFCTAGQAKRDYMASLGMHPDVWIDDDPASITTDDATTAV